jgi:HAE1 family hydrophobic/amphiphilic exporter-1
MQKLAEICIKRPVFAAMIILALVVIGASSYFKLGVDRFPAVDVPTVTVRATLPGASPEEAESTLAQTLEEAVNTVEGIEMLRSVSSQGRTFVTATFGLDRDIDNAAQDVRDRVQGVTRLLPPGTDPPIVQKFDNERQGILTIALSSDRSVRELSELADNVVRKQLERSAGVGEINISGGITRSINVWVDADRLAAYGIPITDVRNAVVRQNADVPGGNVDNGRRELSLRTMGRFVDPGLFNDLVIKTVGAAPIRVRDIGYAEDGTKEQRSISRLTNLTNAGNDPQKRAETPGVPSVAIEVRRQTGANTMAVI